MKYQLDYESFFPFFFSPSPKCATQNSIFLSLWKLSSKTNQTNKNEWKMKAVHWYHSKREQEGGNNAHCSNPTETKPLWWRKSLFYLKGHRFPPLTESLHLTYPLSRPETRPPGSRWTGACTEPNYLQQQLWEERFGSTELPADK